MDPSSSSSPSSSTLPPLSSLLAQSSHGADALFAHSSPFASTSDAHLQSSSSARISAKISSEWSDATSLHPAIAAQQAAASGGAAGGIGPTRPSTDLKGKGRADAADLESQSIQSEWIDNVSGAGTSAQSSQALVRRSDAAAAAAMPGHEYDRNSSLPLALQLKRRQLDKTAKPETYHPRWKLSRVIAGHLGWVRSIAVEPGNQWFATGAGDRMIKIWDLASGELKLSLTGHISAVRGLAVSDRHPYLFSCGEDKMVKCWDLEQNKVIRQYHGHLSGIYSLSLHPTLDVIVTAGRDATARVWDMRTKAQVHVLSGHTGTIANVQCQESDPQVITGSMDSTVRLWDLAAGKTMTTLTHHKKSVRALAVHPTKFSFASGSAGGNNIKTWVCPEGTLFGNMAHETIVNTMSVNADGVLFSGGDNGSMKVRGGGRVTQHMVNLSLTFLFTHPRSSSTTRPAFRSNQKTTFRSRGRSMQSQGSCPRRLTRAARGC